ncbi:hypothetical protein LTR66_006886 [Elasticomyces elasticus]|nr:hypothetical protein LTR50_004414 [Elasticomyces elasticus]KAK4990156.1 hypothetical protein LTR66_006886 [Elasticomyces elasticus]
MAAAAAAAAVTSEVPSSASFYCEDICALKATPSTVGVVDITFSDVDSHVPRPYSMYGKISRHADVSKTDYRRFMKDGVPPQGHVLIQWRTTPKVELIPTSELVLLDRSLLLGDIVKKDAQSAMSGTVVKLSTTCTLMGLQDLHSRVLLGGTLRGFWPSTNSQAAGFEGSGLDFSKMIYNVPVEELVSAHDYNEDDVLIYQGWIGRILETLDEVSVQLGDGSVVVVESADDLEPFDKLVERLSVGDVVRTKKHNLRRGRWKFGAYNPNQQPCGTVVETRTIAITVGWLERKIGAAESVNEPSAELDLDILESGKVTMFDCFRKPSGLSTAESPTLSAPQLEVLLGMHVRFKDIAGAAVKYSSLTRTPRTETLGYDLNVLAVSDLKTEVTVQWQDLSLTVETSNGVVPDGVLDDEYAVWPGEIVHTYAAKEPPQHSDEIPWIFEPARVGVVQEVNAQDRLVQIRWCPDASVMFMKADVHTRLPSSVLGPARGVAEDVSMYDVTASASMNVRRGDFVMLTPRTGYQSDRPDFIDWVGEVVDVGLDGFITVRLGALPEVQDVRILPDDMIMVLRSDGSDDPLEDGSYSDPAMSDVDDDYVMEDVLGSSTSESADSSDERWYHDEDGRMIVDTEDGEWSTENENEDEEDEKPDGSMDESMEESMDESTGMDSQSSGPQIEPPDSHVSIVRRIANNLFNLQDEPATSVPATPPIELAASQSSILRGIDHNLSDLPDELTTSAPAAPSIEPPSSRTTTSSAAPPPFAILESRPPTNHHYLTCHTPTAPGALKRIQKELRILHTSLPQDVFVRTWDSRLDLLRVLIVGPVETPYEYAPFLIDLYLGDDFPNSPPQAFFHSWSSGGGEMGHGPVNPNLYEDGKICLSLLGTWDASAKSENWSPNNSTVLQVLVSLLGLVLVREPYYNEAGYDILTSNPSTRQASNLYTERTYIRARAFILHALTHPLAVEGLSNEITWLYRRQAGAEADEQPPNLLTKAITAAREIVQRSETARADVERDGLRVVTKGACVPFKRVIARLEGLRDKGGQ